MEYTIAERKITPVKAWNSRMRAEKNYIMVFTLGVGSMVDEPRQVGYVVSKTHREGGERHKFHLSHDKALADFNSDIFN